MKKVSFALVLVMFLFACATSEKYDRKLAGWVGKDPKVRWSPNGDARAQPAFWTTATRL